MSINAARLSPEPRVAFLAHHRARTNGAQGAVHAQKYLGRTVWRRWSECHRRSRVETKPLGIMRRVTLSAKGCVYETTAPIADGAGL